MSGRVLALIYGSAVLMLCAGCTGTHSPAKSSPTPALHSTGPSFPVRTLTPPAVFTGPSTCAAHLRATTPAGTIQLDGCMGNVFIPAATVHVRVGDEILISGVGAASTLVASVPTLIQQAGDLFMAAQPGDTTIFASIPSCYGGAEASGHPAADCRTPIMKIVAS